jgi:hypothetical protein
MTLGAGDGPPSTGIKPLLKFALNRPGKETKKIPRMAFI